MSDIRAMLTGGDRRSIGRADEAVDLVRLYPGRTAELIECLWDVDACVSMRAADALEKVSRENVARLQPYKGALFDLFAEAKQKEIRWHLALIIPRMLLSTAEFLRAAEILESYLEDRSSIVKTFAMQGLADLALRHTSLLPRVLDLIRTLTRTGTPAMRARGRILLKQLEATEPQP
ncbi:hypothetical protein [Nevskia soli]|uniref:hypothetical protein n=1 Tax=Nevskia soli TaxID=418856 RepID=UPI0015D87AD1|nr:hypothetical protein [Nevskia soli]